MTKYEAGLRIQRSGLKLLAKAGRLAKEEKAAYTAGTAMRLAGEVSGGNKLRALGRALDKEALAMRTEGNRLIEQGVAKIKEALREQEEGR